MPGRFDSFSDVSIGTLVPLTIENKENIKNNRNKRT
jgi:hypothetical protein